MGSSALFGVLAVATLAAAWVGVQAAWRRSFPDAGTDPDALAVRGGCGRCGCDVHCRRIASAPVEEEER